MAEFTIKVGKETVIVRPMSISLITVVFKGANHLFTYSKTEDTIQWSCKSLDAKTVDRIGRGIEKYLSGLS